MFRRGGDVWRMAPDGTGQRQLTSGGGATSGRPRPTTARSSPPTPTGRCTAGRPPGAQLNVIPPSRRPPTRTADGDAHARPPLARRREASPTTRRSTATSRRSWTGADATAPALTGQDGFVAPSWIGNERLLLSRDISIDSEGTGVRTLHAGRAGGAVVQRHRRRAGRPASTRPRPVTAAGWRSSPTTRRRAKATPTRVVLRLFAGDRRSAASSALEAADTYDVGEPVVLAGRVARGVGGERRHPRRELGARRLRAIRARRDPAGRVGAVLDRVHASRRRPRAPVDPGAAGEGAAAHGAVRARGRGCGSRCPRPRRCASRRASGVSRGCSTMRGRTRCGCGSRGEAVRRAGQCAWGGAGGRGGPAALNGSIEEGQDPTARLAHRVVSTHPIPRE